MSQSAPELESDVSLRFATPEDVPTILALIRALAEYQNQAERVTAKESDLLRDGFGPSPQFECILAERDGQTVGLAIFHDTYSTWSGSRGLFIEDLFVDEAVRGRGVGRKLIRKIAQIAKERQCGHVELNVVHANPSRNIYDRYGFAHVDDVLTYRLSSERFMELSKPQ